MMPLYSRNNEHLLVKEYRETYHNQDVLVVMRYFDIQNYGAVWQLEFALVRICGKLPDEYV